MLAGDEARRLGAALAAAAELEGRGELADIRARLRSGDRLRGAKARTCKLRLGQRVEDLGVFKVTKEWQVARALACI